jgi:uncharacterized SAM-binding protein YcdF (DUF218 family)
LLAAVAGMAGRRRTAILFATLAFIVAGIGGWTRTGALLLQPLEDRFARPAIMPAQVDGIIVLGGGFEGMVNKARGGTELSAAGDRYMEALALARVYPAAKIVVTGGIGRLLSKNETDAQTAPRLFARFGIGAERLILEGQSRNTDENARFVAAMIEQKPGETWLLVTSAFHMPRSVGLFRKAGLEIVPWPADYRTPGTGGGLLGGSAKENMDDFALAIREWAGLVAYRLSGRIDDLFPAP